ncbi:MAG: acetyltransferase [Dehalococcoidales bacterium]|nr:acetyltransferase [Dehalococcoidales bacterium]
MTIKAGKTTFSRVKESDLPLLHRWFNTPHVSKWWEIDGKRHPSLDLVKKHYSPRISGDERVDVYLIIHDGTPIGMVQLCKMDDEPAEKANFGLDRNCAGIDLLIGEADYVHRGLSSGIIREFLKQIVFKEYDVDRCIADPYVKNEIAIKAYKKAGFKYLRTVWYEKEGKREHILCIDRNEIVNDAEKVGANQGR